MNPETPNPEALVDRKALSPRESAHIHPKSETEILNPNYVGPPTSTDPMSQNPEPTLLKALSQIL